MSTVTTILAIDPGGTTGLAWRMPDGSYMTAIATTSEEVWDEIRPGLIAQVVYEQFGGRLLSEHGLHTVRVIGGIQALCNLHKIPVTGRQPQTRRAFIDKARQLVKTQGKGYLIHEIDALAHLLSYEHIPDLAPKRKTTARHYTRSRA